SAEAIRITVIVEQGQMVLGQTKWASDVRAEFTPKRTAKNVKTVVVGRKVIEESPFTKIMDNVVDTLMMTKTVSVNYSETKGTYIPGYKYSTKVFGLYDPLTGNQVPGIPYVLGIIPADLDENLTTTNWIVDNDLISDKFKQTYSNQLRLQASLQPVSNMRITLNSDRRFSENYVRYLIGQDAINHANAQIDGNYSMSYNTIAT